MPPIHRPLDKVVSEKGTHMVNNLSGVREKKTQIFAIHQPGGLGLAGGKKERKEPEVVVKGAQGFPSFSTRPPSL